MPRYRYRVIVGSTYMGHLLGMGCEIASMLVLAIFYLLFIFVHKFISGEEKANKISNMIAIIGFINIPIIKYSVEWWNTLHQPASVKILGSSTIHSSMLVPLLLMFFVLILYCALIFNEIQDRNH